jgi:hypothetical protein
VDLGDVPLLEAVPDRVRVEAGHVREHLRRPPVEGWDVEPQNPSSRSRRAGTSVGRAGSTPVIANITEVIVNGSDDVHVDRERGTEL